MGPGGERTRANRCLGQRRLHVRLRAVRPIGAAEYRRATEVAYLGYVYATMAVLPRMKERGHGTVVQVGSALAYRGSLCRRPTVGPNMPSGASTRRCGASCSTRRAGSGDDGADAGDEHPAVLLVLSRLPDIRNRSHRYTGPSSRTRPSSTPPTTRGAASTGWARAPPPPWPRTPWLLASWTGTWAGPGSSPSKASSPGIRTPRRICGNRPTAPVARTSAPAAPSPAGRSPADPQLWASHHHGLLAVAGSRRAGRWARRTAQAATGDQRVTASWRRGLWGGLTAAAGWPP